MTFHLVRGVCVCVKEPVKKRKDLQKNSLFKRERGKEEENSSSPQGRDVIRAEPSRVEQKCANVEPSSSLRHCDDDTTKAQGKCRNRFRECTPVAASSATELGH